MFFFQLRQLVWKNALTRSRSKARLVTELIWPLAIFIILALVRTRGLKEYSKECYFEEKALPSSGSLRYYQNVICTSLNWCYNTPPEFPYLTNDDFELQRIWDILNQLNGTQGGWNGGQVIIPDVDLDLNDTNNCNISWPFVGVDGAAKAMRFDASSAPYHKQISHPLAFLDTINDFDRTPLGKLARRLEQSNKANEAGNNSAVEFLTVLCGHDPLPFIPATNKQSKTLKWDRTASRFRYFSTSRNVRTDLSEQCQNIFDVLNSDPQTEAMFGYLYPLIRGKLVYSPNTPAFAKLVQKVNETFQDAKEIQDIANAWLEVSPNVTTRLEQINASISNAMETFENCTQIMTALETAQGRVNQTLELVARLDALATVTSVFIDCFEFDRFEGFPSEQEALTQGYKLLDANQLWAVIIFDYNATNLTSDVLPEHVTYKIRMDKFVIDSTKRVRDYVETPLPRNDPRYGFLKYFTSGFIFLQDRIEQAIISMQTSRDQLPAMYMQQTPGPCYVFDVFLFSIASSIPLYFNLAFVYTCAMTVKSIVHEKERRLKETMRTMGLSNAVHWVAWFIDSMGVLIVACILLPIIIYYGNVLEQTNPLVLFVLLLSFSMATVSFSFLISTLFSRANLAAASGAFIYFLTYQPCNLIDLGYDGSTFAANLFLSLFSNVAFGIGTAYVAALEELDGGAQWHNIATSPRADDSFSLLACILMLLFDSVLYLILAWYIENVRPGQFGIPRPWYFPFQRSYWFSDYSVHEVVYDDDQENQHSDLIEKEKKSSTVGVKIRNLSKTYSNGKVALTKLNLEFYNGQITSFLGHNGAGKTTTISILTGLFPATSGSATINGLDIRTQINEIRRQLGVCPQYNVLFDELTVEEHLRFYAALKTGRTKGIEKDIDQMIEDIGLPHKRHALSRHLSGGMKRKLSIGTAFIGNSKTVILDEPTAGVDPFSRRSIWELLLKFKSGRTIILTTHFMDEADILGDRIAIISQGQLKCCGSSLFLKEKLGSGYYLTLVKKDGALSDSNNASGLEATLKTHVQNAKMVQDVGTDIVFCLPELDSDGNRQRENFPALFDELDAKLEDLGLDSYGVSDTTLEEIFLKVANDPADGEPTNGLDSREAEDSLPVNTSSAPSDIHSSEKLVGARLIFQQLKALYKKRVCNTKRNWKGLFCEIILPCVLVLIGEIFSLTLQINEYDPPLKLNPWLYGESNVAFYANRKPEEAWSKEYVSNMLNVSGMGVRCLNEEPLPGLNCSIEYSGLLNPMAQPLDYPEVTCPCTLGVPDCSQNYSANDAELFKYGSVTSDEFYDLSEKNISTWIIRTHEAFKYLRSGGFELGVHISTPAISNITAQATENIRVWFDNKAWASSVAYLNAINNVVLRSSLPPTTSDSLNYGITVVNHPMEYSSNEAVDAEEIALSFAYAITVIFALCFVPASFVMFLVEERVSKAKLLQFVSGVKPTTFWIAAYTWDLIYYLIPCAIIILIFVAFGEWEFVGRQSLGGLILLFILFGAAAIPLLYPASLVFSVPSTAFVALACANLFIGVVTTISSYVLQLFDDEKLVQVGQILDKAFLIFPHFCLGRGLIDLSEVYYTARNYELIGVPYDRNIFEWDYLGCYFFFLFLEAVVFFLFNLSLHYELLPDFIVQRFHRNIEFSSEIEDVDVARERLRVEHDLQSTDELRILGLTKVYKGHKKPATDRISFGLQKGECFGLLGVNGAGKSTTFKMLTGDISVTSGDAFISGYSVLTHLPQAQQNLGYCPQEDAILPLLTGIEHLELFARLRGVPDKYIDRHVIHSITKLGLQPYKNRCAGTYSGGNKRKLSTAIAFVGNPSVIFLDEPSSGMDPRARRSLWGVVTEAIKESRSVLLTSHSMEECQVLCNRLAIMVNGTLRCLGSPQHLKNRFGDGYMINVRCEIESVGDVLHYVRLNIPEARLREQRSRQIIWHVKPNILTIATLFQKMEAARTATNLVDYSITQTTLDDVFVRFARLQRELHEDANVEGSDVFPLSSDIGTSTGSVISDVTYCDL